MKILICTLGSAGFYNPMIGLAKALETQGHKVAFVAHHRKALYLRLAGVMRLSVPCEGEGFTISQWINPEFGALQFKDVMSAIRDFTPDLIVTQPMVLGCIAAARYTSTPFVTVGQFTPLWQEYSWQDPGVPKALSKLRNWRARELCEFYLSLCRHLNLTDQVRDSRDLLGVLHLIRSVEPWLQERLPQGLAYAGSMLWEAGPSREVRDWLARMQQQQRKIIYVQHGKRFFLDTFWEKLPVWSRSDEFAFALSTGQVCPSPVEWPENVLCLPYIPQSLMFTQCSHAVLHGHTTSVLGALLQNEKTIVLPAGGETVDNAIVCRSLGSIKVIDDWSALSFDEVINHHFTPHEVNIPETARGFDLASGLICNVIKSSQLMAFN
ncbi:hypothetical protein [Pseudoalteromonas sp. OOF1S-7]|uniref:glycosyltransferase n=1 Tax=Pseudoalteromonas sp. OOF1S-7 TaxID=2917757 RepID=UPI001EF64259|nr:hypothetical protein [Pseudoalteromonas sp. OOF1S-7]MCG7536145.1 hypothetical protein [Pseudoalteromonas sp. OOF1S-7]